MPKSTKALERLSKANSFPLSKHKIVVDNIHGDICLNDLEWRIVDTPSFQRLRSLKQLGMGHLTYPNATHSRFAHSLGVFRIMSRFTGIMEQRNLRITKSEIENLRLAALLHGVGHYPYSHLMEKVDKVTLTEDQIENKKTKFRAINTSKLPYPDHETLGRQIVENRQDLLIAIGSKERAREIGALFTRNYVGKEQLSKLLHSSLDVDRLDYLVRDSHSCGAPFGQIDLDYLLNNIDISPKGMLGIRMKALGAAEHFLLEAIRKVG